MQIQDRFKFRAKRIDNNKFVFGHLCFIYIDNPKKCSIYCPYTAQSYDCYTDTLGQCTGLKDKNGRLIYENDIIEIISIGGKKLHFRVAVSDRNGGYYFPDAPFGYSFDFLNSHLYEVVGNIHENPELLEDK